MNQITIATVDGLEPRDLLAIRSRLTHADSEFQAEVSGVLEGESSSCTPIAVCHSDGALIGWACSHIWRAMQTLEQYVDERHRKSGKGTALSASLIAFGVISAQKPLAVFSPTTASIARRLGCAEVVLFERRGADWVEV